MYEDVEPPPPPIRSSSFRVEQRGYTYTAYTLLARPRFTVHSVNSIWILERVARVRWGIASTSRAGDEETITWFYDLTILPAACGRRSSWTASHRPASFLVGSQLASGTGIICRAFLRAVDENFLSNAVPWAYPRVLVHSSLRLRKLYHRCVLTTWFTVRENILLI